MRIRFGQSAGYTLTEMMVVVGIIGLLSALAVPNFLDWNRRARLRDAASSLAWNLNLARMNAVNQNAVVTVTVCHQSNPCPGAAVNATPTQVTVFFQNGLGTNVVPPMTMATDVALTNATNALVGFGPTSPQVIAFNPLGLKVASATPAPCLAANGSYNVTAGCESNSPQAFNFRSLASANYNYRIIVLTTGKVSWCTDANCTP